MPITVSPSGGAAAGSPLPLVDLDCSSNPNYPAAAKGYRIRVTVAGKIGGASGKVVEAGDVVEAVAANAGGDEAAVGTSWIALQANIAGMTAAGLSMITAADAAAQAALLTGTLAGLTTNTFSGLQTITQGAANTGILASTGYSLTGSNATSMINLAGTLNTTGVPSVIKLNVTNTASGAGTKIIDLQISSLPWFSLHTGTFGGTNLGGSGGIAFGDPNSGGNSFTITPGRADNVLYIGCTQQFGLDIALRNTSMAFRSAYLLGWSEDANSFGTQDLILGRKAAATLRLGVDAAGVTNQMLTAASRITSDGVGANLTIAGGNGRGGAGGSLILSYYTTAGAATIGTLTEAMRINTLGQIVLTGLPAADPGVAGALYHTAGAVMVSL